MTPARVDVRAGPSRVFYCSADVRGLAPARADRTWYYQVVCQPDRTDRRRRQHKAEDYNIITGYRHSIAFYTVCAVLRRPARLEKGADSKLMTGRYPVYFLSILFPTLTIFLG